MNRAVPAPVTMVQLKRHVVIYIFQCTGFVIIPLFTAVFDLGGATFLKMFFGFALAMFATGMALTGLTPAQQANINRYSMFYPLPPVFNALMIIVMIGIYFVNPYYTVAIAFLVGTYELSGFFRHIRGWTDYLEGVNFGAR